MAENQQSGQEPNGESQDIDYKAKYEEAIAHSREWEKRAKPTRPPPTSWNSSSSRR